MVELTAQDDQLSTFLARGQLTSDELAAAYADFVRSAPTPYELWDLSSASLAALHTEGIHRLAQQLAEMAKDRGKGGKSALVCTRDLEFGMARMLAIFLSMEEYSLEVQVFRSVRDAKAWLFTSAARG
jgi:hypothetical protein